MLGKTKTEKNKIDSAFKTTINRVEGKQRISRGLKARRVRVFVLVLGTTFILLGLRLFFLSLDLEANFPFYLNKFLLCSFFFFFTFTLNYYNCIVVVFINGTLFIIADVVVVVVCNISVNICLQFA